MKGDTITFVSIFGRLANYSIFFSSLQLTCICIFPASLYPIFFYTFFSSHAICPFGSFLLSFFLTSLNSCIFPLLPPPPLFCLLSLISLLMFYLSSVSFLSPRYLFTSILLSPTVSPLLFPFCHLLLTFLPSISSLSSSSHYLPLLIFLPLRLFSSPALLPLPQDGLGTPGRRSSACAGSTWRRAGATSRSRSARTWRTTNAAAGSSGNSSATTGRWWVAGRGGGGF